MGLPTDLLHFAKLLSVERVWIVTGTPTTNLLGQWQGSEMAKSCLKSDFRAWDMHEGFFNMMKIDEVLVDSSTSHESMRIWSELDRRELKKLGNMITHFINVPLFHSNLELFTDSVMGPLLDGPGPLPGSVQVLIQVMEMVMIRHR